MSVEYQVGGSVLNVKANILVEKLIPLFPDLKHRPRIYGYDIKLIRHDFELYLNTLDEIEYSLEITFYDKEKELLSLITVLRDALLSLGLKFHIWYCKEDEDGNALSDEVIFFDNHITSN